MISGRKLLYALLLPLFFQPATAAEWNMQALAGALADIGDRQTPFHEKRTASYLDRPLQLSGYVRLSGQRIEKHVTAPTVESIVIEGDRVVIEAAGNARRELDVHDHPLLQGLATALRAALRGDLSNLGKDFEASLQGGMEDWRLELIPRDAEMRVVLQRIDFSGSNGLVQHIRVVGEQGDESLMTLEYDRQ